jgi:hypothetical protein
MQAGAFIGERKGPAAAIQFTPQTSRRAQAYPD